MTADLNSIHLHSGLILTCKIAATCQRGFNADDQAAGDARTRAGLVHRNADIPEIVFRQNHSHGLEELLELIEINTSAPDGTRRFAS